MGDKTLLIFVALCCINHDHVNYGPGQSGGVELALTQAQADPLLAVGAIKAKSDVDAEVVAASADVDTASAQAQLDALVQAKAVAQAELDALLKTTADVKAVVSAATVAPAKKK